MKRHCALDDLLAFNYNTGAGEILFGETSGKKVQTDTRQFGSTLMQTMQVGNFCDLDTLKTNFLNKIIGWNIKLVCRTVCVTNNKNKEVVIFTVSSYQYLLLSSRRNLTCPYK